MPGICPSSIFSVAPAWAATVTTEWAMATCIGRTGLGRKNLDILPLNHECTLGVRGVVWHI